MASDKLLSGTTALAAMPTSGNHVIDMVDPADSTGVKRIFGKLVPRPVATVSMLLPATLADNLVVAVFQPDNSAYQTTMGALKAYFGGGSGSAGVPTLGLVMPTGVQPASSYTVAGSYSNDGTSPVLTVSVDGGAFGALPAGSTVSGGTISLLMPGLGAGTHTVQVKDGNGVLSNTVSFVIAAPETLTVNTPGRQTVGTDFFVTGTYANGPPGGIDYSLDGGQSWMTATGTTLTAASGNFGIAGVNFPAANSAATVMVRDHAKQSIVATSGTFAVAPGPFASPLTFAGAQGQPTGKLALSGANASHFTLDGAGGLACGTAAYEHALLVAAGYTPAVSTTITVTPKNAFPMMLGRMDAARQNGGFAVWIGGDNLELHVRTNGVETTLSWQYGTGLGCGVQNYSWTSFGIRIDANGVWHPQVNGADMAIPGGFPAWTPPNVAQGYVEVGAGWNSGAVISQITVG